MLRTLIICMVILGSQWVYSQECKKLFQTDSKPEIINNRFVEASPGFEAPIIGYGQFSSIVTTLEIKKDSLQHILPNELQLAKQKQSSDYHPVFIMFGHNQPTHINNIPINNAFVDLITMGSVSPYHELIVFIPYVQFKNSSNQGYFNYSHRFYLDSVQAQKVGIPYKFPKELARLENDNFQSHYRVSMSEKLLASAQFDQSRNGFDSYTLNENLQHILTELPVLNYDPGTKSYMSASFDFKNPIGPWPLELDVFFNETFFGKDIESKVNGMFIKFDFGMSLPISSGH